LERGIELFNQREFFECHEVLEEEWTPERGPRRLFLQSLIHVAVGLYHAGRENPVGASRQLRKALRKLGGYLPECEGVDTERLYREAADALAAIEAGASVPEVRIHGRLNCSNATPKKLGA
jgi:predicted metal-dependent hydrolase